MRWSKQQVKEQIVRRVRKEIGDGWRLLVPRLQKALIAEAVLGLLNTQDAESIPTESIGALWQASLVEADLADDPS